MSMSTYESKVKRIVVIGDGAVGKTCLLTRFKDKVFDPIYIPTIFDNYEKEIYVDSHLVVLSLMDTAGQEGYDRTRCLCYPKTDVFLVCFDISNSDSFKNISDKWLPELREHCDDPRIVLVGTKSDLREDRDAKDKVIVSGKDMVSKEQALALCHKIKAVNYMESSARTGEGVEEVFEAAARNTLQIKEMWEKGNGCCLLM